jgi:membrane protein insertase Oxa1/YidC/SpoIIIJ
MAAGGVYWFEDLTKPDKYLALPLLCTFASYAHLTTGGLQMEMGNSQMNTKQMMNFMKVGGAWMAGALAGRGLRALCQLRDTPAA